MAGMQSGAIQVEAQPFQAVVVPTRTNSAARSVAPVHAREILLYRACDDLSGILICLMVVFSPWAFGTTQPWSKWTMNAAGYVAGGLLAAKLFLRLVRGYEAPRWNRPEGETAGVRVARWTLVALTFGLLAYCLTAAVNARSTYRLAALGFEYHDDYVSWLPHSFDSSRTWQAFWEYLALGLTFWAIQDWLLGKSATEQPYSRASGSNDARGEVGPIPARFRLLLWVLALNGLVLGLEGILQRLEGSGKLLFLVRPRVNPGALSQFGPWAYRANAAAYFNLLWPVCVGFWFTLQRAQKTGVRHHWLLGCAAVMAACPIISTSRGGALVTAVILAAGTALLGFTHFLSSLGSTRTMASKLKPVALLVLFAAAALGLGWVFGWKSLGPRLQALRENYQSREAMFDTARPMARDYPLYGTGPGTFRTVFQLYRISLDTYWPAQLHNDWLETRITFGWAGSALIALALLAVLARYFARGGIYGGRRFVLMVWLALAGCLLHARFDFPFQIHSIVFLFLVICALLFNLSRSPA